MDLDLVQALLPNYELLFTIILSSISIHHKFLVINFLSIFVIIVKKILGELLFMGNMP